MCFVLGKQACGSADHHDAASRVLSVAVDLERHLGPHRDSQELVALGCAEQKGAILDRIVDRGDVDLVDESVGKSRTVFSRPPATLILTRGAPERSSGLGATRSPLRSMANQPTSDFK